MLSIILGIVIVLNGPIVWFQRKCHAAAGHQSGSRLSISSSGASPLAVAGEETQDKISSNTDRKHFSEHLNDCCCVEFRRNVL